MLIYPSTLTFILSPLHNTIHDYNITPYTALESALEESNLLSADSLLAACTLLSNLKQRNGAAILQAAVNSGDNAAQYSLQLLNKQEEMVSNRIK